MSEPCPNTCMSHADALREGVWAEIFWDADFNNPVLVAYDAGVVEAAYRALSRKQRRYIRAKRLTDYLTKRISRSTN